MALNEDDQDDDDAGQVLHPAEAIGEGLGRLAAGQHEGDPQRDGRRGIADVVDGVGEQRDASPRRTRRRAAAAAVTARMTKDHLIAQMPRSVVAIVGSMTPWRVAVPAPWSCTVIRHGRWSWAAEAEPVENRRRMPLTGIWRAS